MLNKFIGCLYVTTGFVGIFLFGIGTPYCIAENPLQGAAENVELLAQNSLGSSIGLDQTNVIHANYSSNEFNEINNDQFGIAVAVDKDVAIIGMYGDDTKGEDAGAAHIYRYHLASDTWRHEAQLLAFDGEDHDNFGYSVSISGNVATVGVINDSKGVGAVYVYRYNSNKKRWKQEDKLMPIYSSYDEGYGFFVKTNGDFCVIGASQASDRGEHSGAVYIYKYNKLNRMWKLDAKLIARDGSAGDEFGAYFDLHKNTLIVGAPNDDDRGENSGSAYIYRYSKNSKIWLEEAKLKARDGGQDDGFGFTVSISKNVAAIAAIGDEDKDQNSGSVYIYRFNKDTREWNKEAKLVAKDGALVDQFGWSLDNTDKVVVVGVPNSQVNGVNTGSIYVYRYNQPIIRASTGETRNSWDRDAKLFNKYGSENDDFGYDVSISKGFLFASNVGEGKGEEDYGSVHVFRYNSPVWDHSARLSFHEEE